MFLFWAAQRQSKALYFTIFLPRSRPLLIGISEVSFGFTIHSGISLIPVLNFTGTRKCAIWSWFSTTHSPVCVALDAILSRREIGMACEMRSARNVISRAVLIFRFIRTLDLATRSASYVRSVIPFQRLSGIVFVSRTNSTYQYFKDLLFTFAALVSYRPRSSSSSSFNLSNWHSDT